MSISVFLLSRVTDNPWNERELDQANVEKIAASIRTDGLLQPPLGRIDPNDPNKVQLAFGHHRLAAYRLLDQHDQSLSLFQQIPVDVRDIDDRTMARYAIIENHHRADPSAIEKARALVRLTAELGMSQAEAGELFGIGQGAVSHLKRLLRLPEPIQAHVHAGNLPERFARELVAVAKVFPQEATKIADAVAKAEPKPSNNRIAAGEAARAQVIAQSARKSVRGHTKVQPNIGHSRPAPKPSAKKKGGKR